MKQEHLDFLEKLAMFLEDNNATFAICHYPGLKYSCFFTEIDTTDNSEKHRLVASTNPFQENKREEYKKITAESIREKIEYFKNY